MLDVRQVLAGGLVVAVIAGGGAPQYALAQEAPTPGAVADGEGRFGVGFQSSWPAYGVSGIYDVNETITAQGVVGAFGSWTTLSGRVMYHFQREPAYSLFGVGSAGLWRYSFLSENESSVMLGGGAGVELNWRRIIGGDGSSNFPPLYSNIDVTLSFASFDHYNWNAFTFGAGLHYRF